MEPAYFQVSVHVRITDEQVLADMQAKESELVEERKARIIKKAKDRQNVKEQKRGKQTKKPIRRKATSSTNDLDNIQCSLCEVFCQDG